MKTMQEMDRRCPNAIAEVNEIRDWDAILHDPTVSSGLSSCVSSCRVPGSAATLELPEGALSLLLAVLTLPMV